MQVPVIEGVEALSDVDLQDPAASDRHRGIPNRFERLVRRAPRAKAVRAVKEVLLVDGLQRHGDRALQYFVLKRRDADGSHLLAVRLGDVDAPHGWRPVRAGLEALEERLEVVFQSPRVRLTILPVDPGRPVLACPPVCFAQPVDVDAMGERRERPRRMLSRHRRYPLKFREDGS
jgi:hypothetical protein